MADTQQPTITLPPIEPPPALQALADHVNGSICAEAEAQRRAGFSYGEAVRRAMILHEPARQEVARMVAAWASFQAPKMIATIELPNDVVTHLEASLRADLEPGLL